MYYKKKDKENFLEILKNNGGNINGACMATGIVRRTIYNWMEKEQWIKDEIDTIREICIDNMESSIYQSGLNGNLTAAIFYLKCHGKERGWIEKQYVEQTTTFNEPLKLNIIIPNQLNSGEQKKIDK